MKVKELLQIVSNIEKRPVKQKELALILKYDPTHFSNMNTSNQDIPAKRLKIIEEKYGIDLSGELEEAQNETNWAERLNLTRSEYEELLQLLQKDKYRILLCLRALAGDKQAIKDLKKLLNDNDV